VPIWGAFFGRPARLAIPADLASKDALIDYLKLSEAELKKIWYFRSRMYHHFSIYKGPNKVRLISAPESRLKQLQRKLAATLDELSEPRKPVHRFDKQRSVKTNALCHLRRRFVVNVDLQDLFPTITQNRIEGMLLSLGLERRVAEIIARICCNDGHLPQGSPSSPVLSNMICFRLDKNLMSIAKGTRCIYTRYADDITFSSHQPPTGLFAASVPSSGQFLPELFRQNVLDAFQQNGFVINTKKTHYADRYSRRIVTGLKVNELVNVDRRYVRNIRATLKSIELLGIVGAEHKFHDRHAGTCRLVNHLRGKISFLTHIKASSDPVVRSIVVRFNQSFPEYLIKIDLAPEQVRERAVWVVDGDDSQGTGKLYTLRKKRNMAPDSQRDRPEDKTGVPHSEVTPEMIEAGATRLADLL